MKRLRLGKVKATLMLCEKTGMDSTCTVGPKIISINTIISLKKSESFKEEIEAFLSFKWTLTFAVMHISAPSTAAGKMCVTMNQLQPRSPAFLAPGIGSVEDNFSTDRGWGMAQAVMRVMGSDGGRQMKLCSLARRSSPVVQPGS